MGPDTNSSGGKIVANQMIGYALWKLLGDRCPVRRRIFQHFPMNPSNHKTISNLSLIMPTFTNDVMASYPLHLYDRPLTPASLGIKKLHETVPVGTRKSCAKT